jgi:hypothetical protein
MGYIRKSLKKALLDCGEEITSLFLPSFKEGDKMFFQNEGL